MATTLHNHRGSSRITLYAATALIAQLLLIGIWDLRYFVLNDPKAPILAWDFEVFWSAARVTLEHGAAAVFSPQMLVAVESTVSRLHNAAPWPYPPPFLLLIIPFGLLPYSIAFALFAAAGIAIYALMLRSMARGLERPQIVFLAAFPGVLAALIAGQNSLLTTAAAGFALMFLPRRAVAAGLCIAVLAVKPQLGVLFPLALLCARQWKAMLAAGTGTAAFVALSVVLLGRGVWSAFAGFLPTFNHVVVEHGGYLWTGMPTVFAMSRVLGLPVAAAYTVQALVALPAVAAMAFLWLRGARYALRAAALVVTTLLVQPYFMFYDLCWLVVPIVFLLRDGKIAALDRVEWTVILAAWLLPVQAILAVFFKFPCELAPAVLIAMLAVIVRRHLMARGEPSAVSSVPTPVASTAD